MVSIIKLILIPAVSVRAIHELPLRNPLHIQRLTLPVGVIHELPPRIAPRAFPLACHMITLTPLAPHSTPPLLNTTPPQTTDNHYPGPIVKDYYECKI